MDSNPLLAQDLYPAFSRVKPEHIKPAITKLIDDCRRTVERVVSDEENKENATWDSLIAPIDEALSVLGKTWGIVTHLNSVVSSDELREAHDEMLPIVSEFYTWLGQNYELYQAYKDLYAHDSYLFMGEAQRRAVELELRDFKLSGIALEAEDKKRFAELRAKLSELCSKFSNNVLDATNDFIKHVTDVEELKGLPESALALARQEAQAHNMDGYILTLKLPSYLPVMQHAVNRQLREEMYRAYVTRASEIGPAASKFDNTEIINEELKYSTEIAEMLGFNTYADLSLATKMAESKEQVLGFLEDLAKRSKAQAQEEVKEVQAYAKSKGVSDLKPWDYPYYSEMLKQEKYSISDEQIRPYFPLNKVLSGLFNLVKNLFGIEVRPHLGMDTWHKDVSFYDIHDKDGNLLGGFYTDLYARERKNGGAWMDSCVGRRYRQDGSLQTPVAYLICNFMPPIGDKPALLNHDEVETLFHEFGHCLHHLLTTVDVSSLAGINNVPWDAVEVPSQFMENFTWQPEVLDLLTCHVDTGAKLPAELLANMLASRNYHSALAMLRQLEFAIFDLKVYGVKKLSGTVQELLNEVRKEVSVLPTADFNRFQNSFTHIFAGGYSAGYYSYKWAEVLSSDIFAKFEESGNVMSSEVGHEYLHKILENGGSHEFMEMFKNFRGREPSIDALLRHSGIKA